MGMYTELNIGVNLNKNTPDKVIKILNYMLEGNDDNDEINGINHPLFSTDRWRWMLVSDSYYFDSRTDSSMTKDSISKCYELNVRCNLKNYDNEISLFLNFIQPYLDTDGFIGYTRYEEYENPTLIYNTMEGIELISIDNMSTKELLDEDWLKKQVENYH